MGPAEGGRAWVACGAAFVTMFVAVGTFFSFGAFLPALSRDLGASAGAAAGAFSLASAVFFGLGVLAGPALDRWGPRPVLLTGAGAYAAGLLAAATAPGLAVVYLGVGLGVGVSGACAFVPGVGVVSRWFHRRRTLAVGITVSGIGLGTLLVAPLSAALIGTVGWRGAYLTLATAGTPLLLAAALATPAPPVPPPGSAPLGHALRSPAYRRLYLAQLLLAAALFVPFVHLPALATRRGLPPVTAAGLVGVVGAVSVLGRLALAPVAQRVGLTRTYRACFGLVAASFLLWLPRGAYPPLLAHAMLFGVGYGGFVALGPAVLAERFGVARMGSLLGVLYTSSAAGAAAGPAVAGVLVEHAGYRWAGGVAAGLAALGAATIPGHRLPGRTVRRTLAGWPAKGPDG